MFLKLKVTSQVYLVLDCFVKSLFTRGHWCAGASWASAKLFNIYRDFGGGVSGRPASSLLSILRLPRPFLLSSLCSCRFAFPSKMYPLETKGTIAIVGASRSLTAGKKYSTKALHLRSNCAHSGDAKAGGVQLVGSQKVMREVSFCLHR